MPDKISLVIRRVTRSWSCVALHPVCNVFPVPTKQQGAILSRKLGYA